MKILLIAVLAALVAFAGGFAIGRQLPPDAPAVASQPVNAIVDPLIIPVWGQGRITGFVAVEMTLELTPGSDRGQVLPGVRDRLLGELYDIGAQGGLQPGIVDPAALQARLLQVAGQASDGQTRTLALTKLVLQENRRKGA